MNVLLTGATGFLGTQVTRVLAESGHRLHVIHRRSSDLQPIMRYVESARIAEVTDPIETVRAAAGMDAIVHMAADLSHWSVNKERIFRTNVIGTRVMAEAAKTAGVPLFVHTSSIAAIGYSVDGIPIGESATNNFIPLRLLYHESKRLAEEEALDAIRYGIRVVILNPGVLYGPRSLRHTFGHTMLELAARKIPGHPTGGLSIADVDDVASAFAFALDKGNSGERYILAGTNLTYAQAFSEQARAVGTTYMGKPLPSAALMCAAKLLETRSRFSRAEPRLTVDNAKIAPLRMWYSSAHAEQRLGYRSRPLEETLARMAAAYRKAGAL
ncbi:MAG TPA: NAD-dependent epimerase/dehydratase family protein [Candidatus Acidoferrales bacterium]|nr:NAD-dependent epimerase/dehydratase family protein [Candidatus Acidoferrales bacterium]